MVDTARCYVCDYVQEAFWASVKSEYMSPDETLASITVSCGRFELCFTLVAALLPVADAQMPALFAKESSSSSRYGAITVSSWPRSGTR